MNEQLLEKLGKDKVKINEPLANHTNFMVGGPADFYYEAETSDEVAQSIKTARELNLPFFIIGGGANVLVGDLGIRGLVIKNNASKIKFLPHDFIEADSGVPNTELIKKTAEQNLSGFERLMKVPGTLGGAIFMNAGDTGTKSFIGDLVQSVRVLDPSNQIKTIRAEEAEFGYRSSRFQKSGEIILSAVLQLKKVSKEKIEENLKDIIVRKSHHPGGKTIGSTFKNPPGNFAGKLLEESGLKGYQIGGAKFSENHANFIINDGTATAKDIKSLIDLAKKTVKEKFGIDLEEEVRYVGEFK